MADPMPTPRSCPLAVRARNLFRLLVLANPSLWPTSHHEAQVLRGQPR